jgi:hypothetical protein
MHICCYYYHHGESHKLGNLLEKSFFEIWHSPKHREAMAGIDPKKCAKVDCKFFKHHDAVEFNLGRGNLYLL